MRLFVLVLVLGCYESNLTMQTANWLVDGCVQSLERHALTALSIMQGLFQDFAQGGQTYWGKSKPSTPILNIRKANCQREANQSERGVGAKALLALLKYM